MAPLINKLLIAGRDIKLSHSLFALPFALLATFLAADGWPGGERLVLIVACMIFARTYAMLTNRYADRQIDAANPRTAGRALPSGRLSPQSVLAMIVLCAAALVICAAMFGLRHGNWWPLVGSPVVLVWLGVYALAKRFTLLCHFILGGALALSPVAAGLAIEPTYLARPALWLLAGFVLLWVAGFDVIYALQDIEVDREQALHSIPARFGRTGAMLIAKVAHLGGLALLVVVQRTTPPFLHHRIMPDLNMSYFTIGLLIVAVLLIAEHRAASRDRFNMAFFTVNGIISCVLGGLGIADVLMY